MGNPAVEAAIKGLSLIGIDVPPSAEGFIELLINAGEDVITEVPRIISFIENLGGEAWSTLQQVVEGMEQCGPVGYIQHQIDKGFSPHVETIKAIHQQKKIMLDTHRTTLATLQTQIQPLFTGPQTFTGPAASQAQTQFNTIISGTSTHLDLLEQSLAVDQTFFTSYQSATESAADAEIIALIIAGVIMLIAGLTVALSGGLSLSLVGVGTIGITAAQGWILAGIGACFFAWGVDHALLVHPISLNLSWPNSNSATTSTGSTTATSQPMVITVINGGADNGGETVITNGDGTGADAGGISISDQGDLALTGAKACATSRANYGRRTGNYNTNFAIGFLQEGLRLPESYGPILGTGPQDTHSEQVIVNYWSKNRIPQLHLESRDHLILLIFTRNTVCIPCQNKVPEWREQLATAAGPGVTIHFYLWQSIDPRAPVGPDNIQAAPLS